jgi:hypothetical protein
MGRVTREHEAALEDMARIFGPSFRKHAVVVVTNAVTPLPDRSLLTRDKLLDEVGFLPPTHFLRRLGEVGGVGGL